MLRPATWVADTVADLESRDRPGARFAAGHRQPPTTTPPRAARIRCCTRNPSGCKPIGTPVGAIDLRESTGGFTLGGLATTLDCRGAARQRRAHPRALRRGPLTAGLAAWGYASGISLGDGSFYGRRAGRSAAKG